MIGSDRRRHVPLCSFGVSLCVCWLGDRGIIISTTEPALSNVRETGLLYIHMEPGVVLQSFSLRNRYGIQSHSHTHTHMYTCSSLSTSLSLSMHKTHTHTQNSHLSLSLFSLFPSLSPRPPLPALSFNSLKHSITISILHRPQPIPGKQGYFNSVGNHRFEILVPSSYRSSRSEKKKDVAATAANVTVVWRRSDPNPTAKDFMVRLSGGRGSGGRQW